MKKSLLAVVGLTAASVAIPAAAQAGTTVDWSDVHNVTHVTSLGNGIYEGASHDGSFEVVEDHAGYGWCDQGQATTGVAVRSLKGTQTLYLKYFTGPMITPVIISIPNVTSAGVVVKDLPAGFGENGGGDEYYVSNSKAAIMSGDSVGNNIVQMLALSPNSGVMLSGGTTDEKGCYSLTKSIQGTPTSWPSATPVVTPPTTKPSKPVVTPTKPAPTKPAPTKMTPAPVKTTTAPAKPVVTPTKPAPSTSKATATATVKVTTPGGTKTTSTSGVVPVTKPVPSGGVTATATVKVPSKGVTAVATETVKPITPSSSGMGPKVQTDGASSNNSLETELAGAGALAAIAGAGVFVARRRSN